MLRILPGCLFSWRVQCYWAKVPHLCYYSESVQNYVDTQDYVLLLVISLPFFLLVHVSSTLFVTVVFSLPQSPSFFPFIWASFYPPDHIFSFAVIGLGITSLNKCRLSSLVKAACPQWRAWTTMIVGKLPWMGRDLGVSFTGATFNRKQRWKPSKVQVRYCIVSGYISKGSLIGILCLRVTHWNWLADGNFIIFEAWVFRKRHPSGWPDTWIPLSLLYPWLKNAVDLGKKSVNLLCKELMVNILGFKEYKGLCSNHSTLGQDENSHRQWVNKCGWLCSNATYLQRQTVGGIWPRGPKFAPPQHQEGRRREQDRPRGGDNCH